MREIPSDFESDPLTTRARPQKRQRPMQLRTGSESLGSPRTCATVLYHFSSRMCDLLSPICSKPTK